MRKFLFGGLAVLALFLLLMPKPFWPENLTVEEVERLLVAHMRITKPRGDGPWPAVLLFHGCVGSWKANMEGWAQWLASIGYVAVEVDSFTGRGLDTEVESVCAGTVFWGNERAGDVGVALGLLGRLAYVDGERLAAVGFGHGSWALLDGLALAAADTLNGLRGVAAFYPRCGFPAASRDGWPSRIPVLMLLSGEDHGGGPPDSCREVAVVQRHLGFPVEYHRYEGTTPFFDSSLADGRRHSFDAEATADARRRLEAFLEGPCGFGAASSGSVGHAG